MDATVLKECLASQDQAYRGFVEVHMKQVDEKLRAMQSTISDLTRSLEFTQQEVEDLKQKVKQQDHEIKSRKEANEELIANLQTSKKEIKELQDRSNYQEDYNRRNNLQFLGMEERPGETWEQSAVQVTKLLTEKLELPPIELERAHRVGQRVDDRHRPIIARFTRFSDREAVMRNVAKLKGTRIFINEDLCPASQEIRKNQLPMLKQAKSEGKIAYFRHTRLIIKDRLALNQSRQPASEVPLRSIAADRASTCSDRGERGSTQPATTPSTPATSLAKELLGAVGGVSAGEGAVADTPQSSEAAKHGGRSSNRGRGGATNRTTQRQLRTGPK